MKNPDEAPVTFGSRLRFLTLREYESALFGASLFRKPTMDWSSPAKERGILFDLSRLEWADVPTLVQLVLNVERALRDGLEVTIALPLPHARKSERAWARTASPALVKALDQRIHRRRTVKSFLEYMRFSEAASCQHLGASASNRLKIVRNYDISKGEADSRPASRDPGPTEVPSEHEYHLGPEHYRRCVPLTWVSRDEIYDPDKLASIASTLVTVFRSPGRGIEALDADSLANVILFEVIDNVRHSGVSHSLVAAWARPDTTPPLLFNYRDFEHDYLEWCRSWAGPILEIAIGDSGIGITQALTKSFNRTVKIDSKISTRERDRKTLKWAFDRWSTSDDQDQRRGTRGLYRLSRVVQKYQGFIVARSSDQAICLDFGGPGFRKENHDPQSLRAVPGTFIRLRIPAFRENVPQRAKVVPSKPDIRFLVLDLGEISDGCFEKGHENRIRDALQLGSGDECLILTIRGRYRNPKAVTDLLRDTWMALLRAVVELRHPAMLAVCGLPGGLGVLENAVDSINSELEDHRLNFESSMSKPFEVWDPVLVLAAPEKAFWAGATKSTRHVLNKMLEDEDGTISLTEVRKQIRDPKARREVLAAFSVDGSLALRSGVGAEEALRLRITPETLFQAVRSRVSRHLQASPDPPARLVTPTLIPVSSWLDMSKELEPCGGAELACLALSAQLFEYLGGESVPIPDTLLTDAGSSRQRVEDLREYLGVTHADVVPGETDPPSLLGLQLVPSGARVVIYADIILSTETARRCISQVLRDSATPVALIALLDARLSPAPVEIWGHQVPVVTLCAKPLERPEPSDLSELNPIDPVTKQPGELGESTSVDDYVVDRASLLEIIAESEALHIGHVGRPGGRHRTFLLDLQRLLTNRRLVEPIQKEVREWLFSGKPSGYPVRPAVWYPRSASLFRSRGIPLVSLIAESLQIDPKDAIAVPRLPVYGRWIFPETAAKALNPPRPIVIVDQFATSGSSLRQLLWLAAVSGATRILYVTLISHLPRDQELLLKSIERISVPSIPPEEVSQADLFEGGMSDTTRSEVQYRSVETKVLLLSSVSIGVFDTTDCPVCLRLAHLSRPLFLANSNLAAVIARRKQSLRRQEAATRLSERPRLLDGRPFSQKSGMWMLGFRHKLETGLTSTRVRIEIKAGLRRIVELIATGTEIPREALWLLRLLFLEIHWLRRPPLSFKQIRSMVADIALAVARNPNLEKNDRAIASSILRTASKHVFARKFSSILTGQEQPPEIVVKQILLDVYTFLDRHYHQNSEVLGPLINSLQTVRHAASSGEIQLGGDDEEALEQVLGRIEVEYRHIQAEAASPMTAWAELKSQFGRRYSMNHALVVVKMEDGFLPFEGLRNLVLNARRIWNQKLVTNEEPEIPDFDRWVDPWARLLSREWRTVRHFIEAEVLPRVRRLIPILRGDYAATFLTTDDRRRLWLLMEARRSLDGLEFGRMLATISEEPRELLKPGLWERYETEVGWWWDCILKPRSNGDTSARLIYFLSTVPTDVIELVTEVCREARSKRRLAVVTPRVVEYDDEKENRVFCSKGLLRYCILHIFENAANYHNGNPQGTAVDIKINFHEKTWN